MNPISPGGGVEGGKRDGRDRSVPGIEEIEITAKLNYPIAPLPEGDSYLGFIFARGEEPEEVEAVLREAHARLHFDIQPVILLQIA